MSNEPTLTSKNLPPVVPPPGTKIVSKATVPDPKEEQIVAKRLGGGGGEPDIKMRNKLLSKRWINVVAGQGQRYHEATSMGFRNANKVDVTAPGYLWSKENVCRWGDCILMVIERTKYLGALKFNQEMALQRTLKPGEAYKAHRSAVTQTVGEVTAPSSQVGKISTFVPSPKEAEGLADSPETAVPKK
ncbi:hypothetical protein LCGC14_1441170 [marine sediment metagenome]|uniref:Uncharacterized protein n=1 Tax=marine sediment metagenome TaxID=412755 RepID=A0A0F9JL98_9ZZZZ